MWFWYLQYIYILKLLMWKKWANLLVSLGFFVEFFVMWFLRFHLFCFFLWYSNKLNIFRSKCNNSTIKNCLTTGRRVKKQQRVGCTVVRRMEPMSRCFVFTRAKVVIVWGCLKPKQVSFVLYDILLAYLWIQWIYTLINWLKCVLGYRLSTYYKMKLWNYSTRAMPGIPDQCQ